MTLSIQKSTDNVVIYSELLKVTGQCIAVFIISINY